jgi:hypothetical protein
MKSFLDTWNTIHVLWENLKWLVSCTDNRFSQQQVTERKVNIANAFLNLSICLDIHDDILVPERDPGLESMFSYDLGLTLPPNY